MCAEPLMRLGQSRDWVLSSGGRGRVALTRMHWRCRDCGWYRRKKTCRCGMACESRRSWLFTHFIWCRCRERPPVIVRMSGVLDGYCSAIAPPLKGFA